jgi:hypothetical protein
MKKFFGVTSLLLLAVAAAFPAQFTIKLGGGMSFFSGNDYNKGMTGYNAYLQQYTRNVQGVFDKINSGLSIDGEFILNITPNIGIGLGAGYYGSSKTSNVEYDWDFAVTWHDQVMYKPTLMVIPVYANFHYFIPLGASMALDLFGGPVAYFVTFKFESTFKSNFLLGWLDYKDNFSSSKTAFGFQAGAGFHYSIASSMALFIEACYRFGTVTDVTGTWSATGTNILGTASNSVTGTMWYYRDTIGSGFDRVILATIQPTASYMSGVRKAEMNLAGIAAKAGIKIGF